MAKINLKLAILHGETDREVAAKAAVAVGHEPPETADVTAVFTNDEGDRLEVRLTAWADVRGLEVGKSITIAI